MVCYSSCYITYGVCLCGEVQLRDSDIALALYSD